MDEQRKNAASAEADGIIEGRNAVIEALRAGEHIDKIYLQKGETDKTLGHIASKARAAGVVVVEADKRKLDAMSRTHAHQGVIALAAVREYVSVESILAAAQDKGEAPLLVVCDEISDPHNLGAVIRTAECAGAHGVVIPKRRSAGLTAVVAKTSAGAVAHVPVARVPNIPALLKDLKKQGVWVFGTAADGTTDLYRRGPEGPCRHRHRQRGGRHDPPGHGELRFSGEHPHAGEAEFPERIRGGGDPAVRGGAPAAGLRERTAAERRRGTAWLPETRESCICPASARGRRMSRRRRRPTPWRRSWRSTAPAGSSG